MKKIAFIIIVLTLIGAAGFYFWQKKDGYLFHGEPTFETEDEEAEMSEVDEEGELEDEMDEETDEDDVDDGDEYEADSDYETPVISYKDCEDDCEYFDDGDEKAYCLEFCGFTEDDPDRKSEGCGELDKLERDACFKQQAVDEQDMTICRKISDTELEKNCERRVLEEILK